MASATFGVSASATDPSLAAQSTPAQGSISSAGAGITGGYTGESLSLKIIIAFLIGLALYNAIELIVLILVTFNKYHGLYFWSLVIAGFGVMPYSLGFLIKFFQLLDPNADICYVAVVLLTVGWYMMITGQSVVLWSRLHLLTNSRRVLRYTLYMICTNAVILHIPTTVLTFGSNSNSLTDRTLMHFVHGYNVMEKIQMVGFFVQECILSIIYIRETLRMLQLSESVREDIASVAEAENTMKAGAQGRKIMYQLLAINTIIIGMDVVLLAVEFANLYLIETTLKGVVYSIKLKLEFAVLGKLVQIVHAKSSSNRSHSNSGLERRTMVPGNVLDRLDTIGTARTGSGGESGERHGSFPDFVDRSRISGDVTHAHAPVRSPGMLEDGLGEKRKRRRRSRNGSWIEEELDKHNID
ncbi:hypothetical protein K458DRAFT_443427 [Lentithecium fluviatile CBS 122367]|uniref:DUF7703 domain-containing protein n=1 Tax=Lentithecium fluviatile CBS 122367 TaxID=1168545 RepID=A0A6G1IYE8_9PLEO|nr:hypothetical protein K458DRAFT_443427 [Lentithecium fluviatile CBS 122367]